MRLIAASFAVLTAALLLAAVAAPDNDLRKMPLAELRDKIKGGWAAQMIGVSFGAPTEFRFNEQIIPEDKLPVWAPDQVSNALDQDDLYVDMTFMRVLEDKGLDATTEDFGAMFREARYRLWHANLAARRSLKRGVPAELTGTPKYNAHANDIDFQIEADFVGLLAPGLPQASNDLCYRAGRVMNYGDGIYGGMFIAGMYSAAFFEKDPRKIVEAGLAAIPAKSPYAGAVRDVLAWSRTYPEDWIKTWNLVEQKWNQRDPCPNGALRPFNIDAKLNGAYVALGLLYGKGDFTKTLQVATRCGQDSDCNPASAAGVLGVVLGYNGIPDHWKAGIAKLANQKFNYTDYSFDDVCRVTERLALQLIQRTGGRLESDSVLIRTQPVKAARLELWDDYGSPVERIKVQDARWRWKGDWKDNPYKNRANELRTKMSGVKGAEASIQFDGTGAIITGPYLPAGGKADIYLDGKLDRTVDVYPDETNIRHSEAVWHAFGLKKGVHSVRLVVRGEPYRESKGSDIAIEDLIVFR